MDERVVMKRSRREAMVWDSFVDMLVRSAFKAKETDGRKAVNVFRRRRRSITYRTPQDRCGPYRLDKVEGVVKSDGLNGSLYGWGIRRRWCLGWGRRGRQRWGEIVADWRWGTNREEIVCRWSVALELGDVFFAEADSFGGSRGAHGLLKSGSEGLDGGVRDFHLIFEITAHLSLHGVDVDHAEYALTDGTPWLGWIGLVADDLGGEHVGREEHPVAAIGLDSWKANLETL
jgi:hypothetical protein